MNTQSNTAFHLRFGNRERIPHLKELMKTVLEPNGFNMVLLEIDKNLVFESRPEVDEGKHSLTKEEAQDLQAYARDLGIEIIPLFQALGHQGWGGSRSALLRAYPEFDETPDVPLDAEWPEIFCRSWCPLHPEVNVVVADLINDLIEAFTPKYFHIGMDEVYEIASDQCERCRGKDRAKLFAKAVNDMHDIVTKDRDIEVMMWGDRLLDAEKFGYDNWEADTFGTHRAINDLPKDIIVLDWHYDEREKGFPTPLYLMEHGFRVMPACWFKENVAEQLFGEAQRGAKENNLEDKFFGKIVTSWHHWDEEAYAQFARFVEGEKDETEQYRLYHTIKHVHSY